uniref:G-protein coupled receptors family 1 profile domain-containing protein n=1 Tax=Oncorhynchus kisutch TaxID=8019 RepID=A0A8C7DQJ8_ONCKI
YVVIVTPKNVMCTGNSVDEYSRRYYLPVTYGIIFCIVSSSMVNLAVDDWIMGDVMCPIVCLSSYFNLYGSILFLTYLSEFHYVAMVLPLRAAQVQRKSWAVIDYSAVWFISILEITTMVYMTTVEKTENVIYVCIIFN